LFQDRDYLSSEAAFLHRYYTGKPITTQATQAYINGVEKLGLVLNEKELRIATSINKHPALFPVYDFGLVRFMPTSHLRRRLLLICSIIECDQQEVDLFLNRHPIKFAFIKLVLLTLKAGLLWFMAFIIFSLKRWK
jgi:hypothetical protein